MNELIKQLKKDNYGKILIDESLKNHTTYKIGGIARAIIYPESTDKLIKLIKKR